MTIKARLLVCLSLLAVAMLVMIVTAFNAMTSISKRTESIVADRLLPVAQLDTVADMYAVEIVDTTHKMRSGALRWADGKEKINAALATIDEQWRAYEATRLTPEEKKLAKTFDAARVGSEQAVRDMLEIIDRQDIAEFGRFIDSRLYAAIDPLAEPIGALVKLQLAEADQELEAAKVEKDTLTRWQVMIAAFAIALLGATVWFVAAGLFRPLTQLCEAMRQLAAGNLKATIFGEGRRDEIGQMAGAVAVFRDNALERQRLEQEAEAGRTLSEREREQREAQKVKEAAEIQTAVNALGFGLDRLAEGDLTYRITRRLPNGSTRYARTSTAPSPISKMRCARSARTPAASMPAPAKSALRPVTFPSAQNSRRLRSRKRRLHWTRSRPPWRMPAGVRRRQAPW